MITAACVQYRVQQGHTVATKYLLKERERRESGRKEKRRKERVKKGLQVVFFSLQGIILEKLPILRILDILSKLMDFIFKEF